MSEALRTLAANLISIVRGAGKPLELGIQVEAFATALEQFRSTTAQLPTPRDLANMLKIDLEPGGPAPASQEEMAELYAQHTMIQASLQIAAARLLGHETAAVSAYTAFRQALSGLEATKRKISRHQDHDEMSIIEQMKSSKQSRRPG